MASSSFAAKVVKSKWGDLDIMAAQGSGKVLCTMGFSAELALLREAETEALVKGDCVGWVQKSKIEFVAQAAGDKTIGFNDVAIQAWIDNPSSINVLENSIEDFDGVTIDRDFREYLTYTVDREQTEMRNGEN